MTDPRPDPITRRVVASDLHEVRQLLVATYAEVYADWLDNPFFSIDRFEQRLSGHIGAPNWEAVIGYDSEQVIGYAYGASVRTSTTFWQHVSPTPTPELAQETRDRTLFLYELMIRPQWRKTGASRLVHDELVRTRRERRVVLTVEQGHPKVRALYERWGYVRVGASIPTSDAPTYDVMVLDLESPSEHHLRQ